MDSLAVCKLNSREIRKLTRMGNECQILSTVGSLGLQSESACSMVMNLDT